MQTLQMTPALLEAPKNIRILDGVRGVAILLVLWFHFFIEIDNPENLFVNVLVKTSVLGQTGVDLFFVLSGFLITRILLHAKSLPGYYTNFYARRLLRIFPLYYAYLAVTFVLLPLLGLGEWIPFRDQLWFWTYTSNIPLTFREITPGPNHFWSLAVEEHFYLLWPVVVLHLKPSSLIRVCLMLCGLALASRFLLTGLGFGVFFFTASRMDALAWGCLLALLELRSSLGRHRNHFLAGAAGAVLALGALLLAKQHVQGSWVHSVKLSVFPLLYFCLLGLLLQPRIPKAAARVFSFGPLTKAGKYAYGMYVLQTPGMFVGHLCVQWLGVLPSLLVAFGTVFLLAFISYTFFERHFLKLKRHFAYTAAHPRPDVTQHHSATVR